MWCIKSEAVTGCAVTVRVACVVSGAEVVGEKTGIGSVEESEERVFKNPSGGFDASLSSVMAGAFFGCASWVGGGVVAGVAVIDAGMVGGGVVWAWFWCWMRVVRIGIT